MDGWDGMYVDGMGRSGGGQGRFSSVCCFGGKEAKLAKSKQANKQVSKLLCVCVALEVGWYS